MFGAELRRLRQGKGWSLRRLAKEAHVSHSYLGEVEAGAKPGSVEVARACDAALESGNRLEGLASLGDGDAVDAIARIGRADVDRRAFLRGAAYSAALSAVPLSAALSASRAAGAESTRTVGMAEANAIREFSTFFVARDEVQGGGIGRTTIAEFLATDVAGILRGRFSGPDARRTAFSAAAEICYLLGWKAHDTHAHGMAQQYYMTALRLAEEATTPGQDAFVLRILALQGADVGKAQFSPDLAEEALRRARGKVGADTEALFIIGVARTLAETGEKRRALAVLRQAEPHLTPELTSEIPRYAALWSPDKATVINQTARAFAALDELAESERYYRLAASIWSPVTHPRIHALAATDAGMAQWRLGAHGDAEATWRAAVPILRGVDSARAEKALKKIAKHIPSLTQQ